MGCVGTLLEGGKILFILRDYLACSRTFKAYDIIIYGDLTVVKKQTENFDISSLSFLT